MSYIESNLIPNEQLVFKTKFHWWLWVSNVFVVIVIGLLFSAFLSSIHPASSARGSTDILTLAAVCGIPLLVLVGFIRTVVDFVSWATSEIGGTTKRIIVKRGVVLRRVVELNLPQFEACQVSETLFGRLLGYKTVVLHGTGGTQYRYTLVARAAELRDRMVEQASQSSRYPGRDLMPQSPPLPARTPYLVPQASVSEALFALPPDDPAARLKEAVTFIKVGKRQEASQIVKSLLQTHAHNADVWYLTGYLHTDLAKKRSAYEHALNLNPNHTMAREALAKI